MVASMLANDESTRYAVFSNPSNSSFGSVSVRVLRDSIEDHTALEMQVFMDGQKEIIQRVLYVTEGATNPERRSLLPMCGYKSSGSNAESACVCEHQLIKSLMRVVIFAESMLPFALSRVIISMPFSPPPSSCGRMPCARYHPSFSSHLRR